MCAVPSRDELRGILEAVKAYLELERAAGCEEFFVPPAAGAEAPAAAGEWQALREEVSGCTGCGLHATRRNTVFGTGNTAAELVFVGEAPGGDEDLQGLPFVGRAGQLLTKIIEAMGFARGDVYIANILKCRPPGNRAPLPAEVAACEGYLRRQIALIRPKVICALGKSAAQTLLGSPEPIGALRGKFREYQGIPLMPTFHPAYLLRNPPDKRLVWEDMKKVMRKLGRA